MSDESPTDGEKLGKDGTIPNSKDGIALGHGAEASHFNVEEDEHADSAEKDLEDPAQN